MKILGTSAFIKSTISLPVNYIDNKLSYTCKDLLVCLSVEMCMTEKRNIYTEERERKRRKKEKNKAKKLRLSKSRRVKKGKKASEK